MHQGCIIQMPLFRILPVLSSFYRGILDKLVHSCSWICNLLCWLLSGGVDLCKLSISCYTSFDQYFCLVDYVVTPHNKSCIYFSTIAIEAIKPFFRILQLSIHIKTLPSLSLVIYMVNKQAVTQFPFYFHS